MPPTYCIYKISNQPTELRNWESPLWQPAEPLEIAYFHPQSTGHHPRATVRLLHDDRAVFIRFDVQDRYVISKATEFQQMVCCDSCVEFFFRPKSEGGYFNIEINAGGTLLMYYIEDPTRTPAGFAKFTPVSPEHAARIGITHSLPAVIDPERSEPTTWHIVCRVPLASLEPYIGRVGNLPGQTWNANFFKCADHSSHPHWASWSPMGPALNFHAPEFFAPIRFE